MFSIVALLKRRKKRKGRVVSESSSRKLSFMFWKTCFRNFVPKSLFWNI